MEANVNTKGNQRYNETKNKIKGTFLNLVKEKNLNQITVTEICKRANIHRTTFYGHYEDVNALLNEMVGEMYDKIVSYFVESDWKNGENGFEKLFTMIRDQKDFFRQYFNHLSHCLNMEDQFPVLLMKNLNVLIDAMGFESDEELYYHQTFFCCGLTAMIRRWLVKDCKETPKEMCRMLAKEYHPGLNVFLWKQDEKNRADADSSEGTGKKST